MSKNYKTYEAAGDLGKKKRHRLILSDADIARFGVVPNKTYSLKGLDLLPEEEKFIPYIIRGIIDGDGCVFATSYGAPTFIYALNQKNFQIGL